jgi:hypothetical protein
MSELQAGMLAMIVGSVQKDSQHIGKTVILKDKGIMEGWGEYWNFEVALCEDAWRALTKHLLPLPPLSDPLDVTHKEELHA